MKKIFLQLLLIFSFLNLFFTAMGPSSSLGRESHQLTIMPVHKQEKIYLTWYNKFNPEKPNKVVLLRPKNWALQHGLIPSHDNKQWAVSNGLPVKTVFVSSVIPFYPDKKKSAQLNSGNSNMVTGIYIYDTDNVRTWKFIDRKKQLTIIHATPNHPFYVQNLKKFLPLQKITPAMTLTDDRQHIIHLLCPAQKNRQCGLPYHSNRVSTVYNMEVNRQHQYFVSGEHILVHNCNPPVFEHDYDQSDWNISIEKKEAAPVEKPDRSNYLVVGCGTVQRPNYPECIHSTIDTYDQDLSAGATYGHVDDIPAGKYNKVLLERVPYPHAVIMNMAPKLSSGTRIYVLSEENAQSVKALKWTTMHVKYLNIVEPEQGHKLLREFENSHINNLGGSGFFQRQMMAIKLGKNEQAQIKSIKPHKKMVTENPVLLEYIMH